MFDYCLHQATSVVVQIVQIYRSPNCDSFYPDVIAVGFIQSLTQSHPTQSVLLSVLVVWSNESYGLLTLMASIRLTEAGDEAAKCAATLAKHHPGGLEPNLWGQSSLQNFKAAVGKDGFETVWDSEIRATNIICSWGLLFFCGLAYSSLTFYSLVSMSEVSPTNRDPT